MIDTINLPTDWSKHRYVKIMAQYDGEALARHEIDFHEFTCRLIKSLGDMIFRQWRQPLPDAMRDYCHIALVDPALVESYIGMRFEDINFQSFADKVSARTYTKDSRVTFKVINGVVCCK